MASSNVQNSSSAQKSLTEVLRLIHSASRNSTIVMKLRYFDANMVGSLIANALLHQLLRKSIKIKILVLEPESPTEINLLNTLYQLHIAQDAHVIDVHILPADTAPFENTVVLQKSPHEYAMITTNKDFRDDFFLTNKSPMNLQLMNTNDESIITSKTNSLSKSQKAFDDFNKDWQNSSPVAVNKNYFRSSNVLTGNGYRGGLIHRKAILLARALYRSIFNQKAPPNDSVSSIIQKILEHTP